MQMLVRKRRCADGFYLKNKKGYVPVVKFCKNL